MNISKDRLLEIEKELNNCTIKSLTSIAQCKINGSKALIKYSKKLHLCPHCNISKKSSSFVNSHFNNCKWKGINLKQFNIDIQTMYRMDVCKKYGIDRKWIRDYAKFHKISLKDHKTTLGIKYKVNKEVLEKKIYTCPHCKKIGNQYFVKHHFDNCKLKGINIKEFNKDIFEMKRNLVCKKYKISLSYHQRYIKEYNIKNY